MKRSALSRFELLDSGLSLTSGKLAKAINQAKSRKINLSLTPKAVDAITTSLFEWGLIESDTQTGALIAEYFNKVRDEIFRQINDSDPLVVDGITIKRAFAMPSPYTFSIKPFKELVDKYHDTKKLWIDPFAGFNSPCKESNDLNPDSPAKYHMQAVDFVKRYEQIDGVLFDPPYSPAQIVRCYKSAGLDVTQETTQNGRLYKEVRDEITKRIKPGGIVMSFGWNSTGFGKKRGFVPIEILICSHGGAHNDTIAVVERKECGAGKRDYVRLE